MVVSTYESTESHYQEEQDRDLYHRKNLKFRLYVDHQKIVYMN
jgi:hypothetical protein